MKRVFLGGFLFFSSIPCWLSAAEATPTTVIPAEKLRLWELLVSGGWVMVPLIAASLVALTLIVYAVVTLRESAITDVELLKRLDPFFENEDMQGMAHYLEGRPQAVAQILNRTLEFLSRHPDADSEAIKAVAEAEGSRLATVLNQRILYILDIGTLSPMLGLFGTVVGILNSFGSIAAEASPMRTMMLAGGVSQALVATAAGLIVGISCLFFYSFMRGRVQGLISLLENHSTLLIQEIILLKKRGKR